ncbi:hypothetical protein LQZ24_06320 [Fructobacillus sp. M1-13]|uniref:Uncharacterized protein n=1 Tax=Fructobacillus papyriferae TaxID=2713171 RepID=A0ABS5QP16_9LACO|nr:hypothetical protein [Fructobacillus papyriferae]MBS9334903.1 hypothetical protein [Fructobacillus papyriferae]MCD2159613.1 hypothetical protein [Fructobacillus papyriferae]
MNQILSIGNDASSRTIGTKLIMAGVLTVFIYLVIQGLMSYVSFIARNIKKLNWLNLLTTVFMSLIIIFVGYGFVRGWIAL